MILTLTDEQVVEMGKLAVLASSPAGMGFLHYDPRLTKDAIQLDIKRDSLHIDYYQGRMVKFSARRVSDGKWEFSDSINREYQSWIDTYPSYQALADAVTK